MQDLGKTYYSFNFNPHELNASNKILWDISNKGLYYMVFGYDGEKVDTMPPEKTVEMFGAYYIFEYIKAKLKNLTKEEAPAVLFKYHVLWSTNKLLRLKYNENRVREILKLIVDKGTYINYNANEQKEKKFFEYVDKAIRVINLTIKRKKKAESTFVLRNLQRSKIYTDDLELEISEIYSPDSLPDLF